MIHIRLPRGGKIVIGTSMPYGIHNVLAAWEFLPVFGPSVGSKTIFLRLLAGFGAPEKGASALLTTS